MSVLADVFNRFPRWNPFPGAPTKYGFRNPASSLPECPFTGIPRLPSRVIAPSFRRCVGLPPIAHRPEGRCYHLRRCRRTRQSAGKPPERGCGRPENHAEKPRGIGGPSLSERNPEHLPEHPQSTPPCGAPVIPTSECTCLRGAVAAQVLDFQPADVNTVDEYAAFVGVVEPCEEVDQRGLARCQRGYVEYDSEEVSGETGGRPQATGYRGAGEQTNGDAGARGGGRTNGDHGVGANLVFALSFCGSIPRHVGEHKVPPAAEWRLSAIRQLLAIR